MLGTRNVFWGLCHRAACFADIILPVTTTLERVDIGQPWLGGPYFIHMDKAIEPLPETKSDLAIFTELVSRLGIPNYNDKSDETWLREFTAATPFTAKAVRRWLNRVGVKTLFIEPGDLPPKKESSYGE